MLIQELFESRMKRGGPDARAVYTVDLATERRLPLIASALGNACWFCVTIAGG